MSAPKDVQVWSVWRDKDKRSMNGNRKVRVDEVGELYVWYKPLHSDRPRLRSRKDRFIKAFEELREEDRDR